MKQFAPALLALGLIACRPSATPEAPATLGQPASMAAMEAVIEQPGPVTTESYEVADTVGPREGLINLENPKAKAAGLTPGIEPIHLYFHVLRHPQKGLFLIDTGVEKALRDDPSHAAVPPETAKAMHLDTLKVHQDTASWLAKQSQPPAAIFLTHMHFDHLLGLADLPKATPIYVGPREEGDIAGAPEPMKSLEQKLYQDFKPLHEWNFAPTKSPDEIPVVDIFGDHTVYALAVPGHTTGSTAFVVRTPNGPELYAGDACHTSWGWNNGVEPGYFSKDGKANAHSLDQLKGLVQRHPSLKVHLGHQSLEGAAPAGK